ncbi:RidA family protein [Propionimicrobium sp. PCR01-08-3]|uniref:RidA family protein n=1 Tax=Propionimicrobium sp. PCR01-08-3 TaxID=3052086 RepID=UPI00255C6FEC|nr:RidA family protein [Propionimicrobium sp. PCR01-08-3]WIY82117.1 RidA family protein [Propionimicrobium sp. PCR01-08-3]
MSASQRLDDLGIELPATPAPLGAYAPAKTVGTQVFTSGQLPIEADGEVVTGRLGADLGVDDGKRAARAAILRALSAVVSVAGSLDAIREVVRVCVFVNSDPGFTDQALVANGASELLIEIFGEEGRHVRSAVGVAVLPANAAVEVELVVEAA